MENAWAALVEDLARTHQVHGLKNGDGPASLVSLLAFVSDQLQSGNLTEHDFDVVRRQAKWMFTNDY